MKDVEVIKRQAGRQASRQAGRQAGRQTDRLTSTNMRRMTCVTTESTSLPLVFTLPFIP